MGFRIGQRVKIVSTDWKGSGESPIGKEGVIIAKESIGVQSRILHDFGVETDCGRLVVCDSHEIEPIAPEGHKVVSWSECLWMPEHMREQA